MGRSWKDSGYEDSRASHRGEGRSFERKKQQRSLDDTRRQREKETRAATQELRGSRLPGSDHLFYPSGPNSGRYLVLDIHCPGAEKNLSVSDAVRYFTQAETICCREGRDLILIHGYHGGDAWKQAATKFFRASISAYQGQLGVSRVQLST